jgi:hypothetical protein
VGEDYVMKNVFPLKSVSEFARDRTAILATQYAASQYLFPQK